jgi:hypothetical protein
MHRKVATLLSVLLLAGTSGLAVENISPEKARKADKDAVLWYDIRLLGLEGQAWSDVAAPFDRLPAKAEGKVRDAVWDLSRHSAGLCVRFTTDASQIQAQWELISASLAMPHMPATGVSGLDLYVKDERGRWRWLANGRPAAKTNTQMLVAGLDKQPRDYLLYLPLYNGVSSVELGLPADATLSKAEPYPAGHTKPIVFYGTSITQGGCASRPGMVHTAIIGRKLNYPVVNLGFSGNGQLEPAVGELMAEIDAAVYVLDCLPNLGPEQVKERTEPLVRQLREQHPDTPILLVEDRTYSDAFLLKGKRAHNDNNRRELKAAYERLRKADVQAIYYLEGEDLLGDDNEGTVDSSHPTDLGFLRQADAFIQVLMPTLRRE